MNHHQLSLLVALAIIFGFFFIIHSMREDAGQAQAAASGAAGKMIARDVEYSRSDKRSIRRALLASDQNLLTMSGRDVRAVLNQPELVRRDLPTVVWQYRNEMCVLDLYFTAASAKVAMSPVVHYEMRARKKGVEDTDVRASCLKGLVRGRAGTRFVALDAFYKSN